MNDESLTVVDCDFHGEERIAETIVKQRTDKNARGRARFAEDICSLHGPSDDGKPCRKFSHLPGNGRAAKQPGIFKTCLVIFRSLLKPLFLCGVVLLAFLILSKWGGSVLRFSNPLRATTGTVSTSHGHSQNSGLSSYRIVNNSSPTSGIIGYAHVR